MKYVKITPDRIDDVIKYLRYTFFADEPLNKAVKLCEPGEGHHESEKYSRKTLESGLSVMAVTDDDEVRFVCSFLPFFAIIHPKIRLAFRLRALH